MMARLRHLPRREAKTRAGELLDAFDLAAACDRRAGTYSGGMRRRLDLAMSMIERPQLLFLDEPTTGLDLRSREQLWGTIRDLADRGVTILLTTQYLEEADQLADTIAVLDRGRIVARGTASQLKASLGTEVVRPAVRRAAATNARSAVLRAVRTDRRLHAIEIETGGSAAEVHELLGRLEAAGTPALSVSIRRPTLDDVFLSLTGDDAAPPTQGDGPMSMACTVSDSGVMIMRCLRRSLRDPEAFFTALMLPIVLMLLFVYVFGGALSTGGKYVDYVVPGLIVLCAGFGAGTTAVAVATDMTSGIVDRFRSMPVSGSIDPRRPRRRQPCPQPDRDRPRDRRRPRHRMAPNRLTPELGRSRRHDRAIRPRPVMAGRRRRPPRPQCRGGELPHHRAHVPPLRQHRVRPRSHHARSAARLRRRTSRSRRSSRPCADYGWDTPPPAWPSATTRGLPSPTARPSSSCRSPQRPGYSGTGRQRDRRRTKSPKPAAAGYAPDPK